jgi:hypothetical protein
MIPIEKIGRITEGKSTDFTKADLTGWCVRVERYTENGYLIIIAKAFDRTGRPISPDPHPGQWTPECGFDYDVENQQLLEQWFQEAGLEVEWPEE